MIHALTIDVEDYHSVIGRDWLDRDGPPTRAVVENTRRLLALMAERDVRGTFFVLGEVAESFPELVREIAAGDHELGVHGYYHRQIFKLTPESFRQEVEPAKLLIEEIAGVTVQGHRAPAFSIMPNTSWALGVLADVGFRYDSSIFPIKGRRYGWPGFPLDIHRMRLDGGKTMIEAPLSTVNVFGRRFPACGGGYLRHFPSGLTQWAIRRVEHDRPAIVYLHPYEIETPCAAISTEHLKPGAAARVQRFHRLQVRNRHTVERKIHALLDAFEFAPLGEIVDQTLSGAARGTARPESSTTLREREPA